MNNFDCQVHVEEFADDRSFLEFNDSEVEALIAFCDQLEADRTDRDLHWDEVAMDVNNEYQNNQPKPW